MELIGKGKNFEFFGGGQMNNFKQVFRVLDVSPWATLKIDDISLDVQTNILGFLDFTNTESFDDSTYS